MDSILITFWNIVKTLLVIGIIIFVHELGHFIAAKKMKIKVERFSIGFGPKMIGFRKGETEYIISWFPIFGGYVKMLGENPAEERSTELEGQFFAAPISHRALIAFSGPAMNIIFAVLVIAMAFMFGMPTRPGTEIGYVEPGSPADKANIMPGDKIIQIDNYKTERWDDISESIGINPDKELQIVLLRNDNKITIRVTPKRIEGTDIGKIGISPVLKPIVGEVAHGSEAERVGLKKGDLIRAINGKRIDHIIELVNELEEIKGQSQQFILNIERIGEKINLPIKIKMDEDGQIKSLDGISFGEIERMNPIKAFIAAIPETYRLGSKVFQFLKRLVMHDVPAKYVAGPVGILQITMSVVKTGLSGILWFAGFLSVNLGIVNLLPLFITDGGILIFLIIEKIRGKPLTLKRQILVQQIGFGFLVLLFLLVTYNDVLRLIRGSF